MTDSIDVVEVIDIGDESSNVSKAPIAHPQVPQVSQLSQLSQLSQSTRHTADKFNALDNILINDSSSDKDSDDGIIIRPSPTRTTTTTTIKKSNLFVPDSSFNQSSSSKISKPSTPSLIKTKSDVCPSARKSNRKKKDTEAVFSVMSSSQPTPRSVTDRFPVTGSVTKKTPPSSAIKRKPINTSKFIESDDSDNEGRSYVYNPITELKAQEKLFLSSTPERIEDSSSIGEIRQSTHYTKPIYPLNQIMKDNVELTSDSDDDDENNKDLRNPAAIAAMNSSPKNEVSNPFLDKLIKHSDKNKKRLDKIKSQQLKTSNIEIAQDLLSSDPIQASQTPARRTVSEAELTRGLISTNEPNERPAQRSRTTGTKQRKSKEERELEKQRQNREKQARQLYQDANKVNRKKDDLLNEMIINLSRPVIRDFDKQDYKAELAPIEIKEVIHNENMVTWSRKANSVYEPESDSFKPSNLHVIDEKVCVFVYKAQEFLDMMEMETMIMKFSEIRSKNKSRFDNFIILINGYDQIIQKLKTQENRNYTAKVRSQMLDGDDSGPGKKTKKRKTTAKTISSYSADEIESEIAQLQVNGFKIFPTKNNHETIQWLKSFTYTISSARYDKVERNPDLANIGTIKSGVNTHDTYLKMLLQFKFMTEVKANRVIDQLPTLFHLYNAVSKNRIPPGPDGKPLMASNIQSAVMTLLSTRDDGEMLER